MRYRTRSDTFREDSSTPRPASVHEPPHRGKGGERAVLVSILLPDTGADLSDPLGELASLAKTAGVDVADCMMQKRMALTPAYGLGKGRLEELAERVRAHEADVVIFDNELAPRQIRGLEEAAGCKVVDRSELILDIFAQHARTREAQLQVELAQLEYTAPRLRGMWTHLERIAGAGGGTAAGAVGGVGTRGPGERQIEVDRRVVRNRIARLRREIAEIAARKQREVKARTDEFNVSLVGYTNSGKSTLMNRLTGSGQLVADQLFATLDTKTVRWELGEGKYALLSDTVGFVRDLPHHLVASFRATLEEAVHADLLLHVVDVSAPTAWQQMEAVDGVLAELGCENIPQITLLNKVDIADPAALTEMLSRNRPEVLTISALSGAGLDDIKADVLTRMQARMVEVTVRVPPGAGKLLAEIDRVAEVRDRRYGADGAELVIRIHRAHLGRLCGRYDSIRVLHGPPGLVQGDGRDQRG